MEDVAVEDHLMPTLRWDRYTGCHNAFQLGFQIIGIVDGHACGLRQAFSSQQFDISVGDRQDHGAAERGGRNSSDPLFSTGFTTG